MLKLIIGVKGTGKTKNLIEMVNKACDESKGSVVCIEKGVKLRYDVKYQVRLINTNEYFVFDAQSLYGFIAGMCASNYDITHIGIDAILRIANRNYDELAAFLEKLNELSKDANTEFIITISADKAELPESIFKFAEEL